MEKVPGFYKQDLVQSSRRFIWLSWPWLFTSRGWPVCWADLQEWVSWISRQLLSSGSTLKPQWGPCGGRAPPQALRKQRQRTGSWEGRSGQEGVALGGPAGGQLLGGMERPRVSVGRAKCGSGPERVFQLLGRPGSRAPGAAQGSIRINTGPLGSGRGSAAAGVAVIAGRAPQGSGGGGSARIRGPRAEPLAAWGDGGSAPLLRTTPPLYDFQRDIVCREHREHGEHGLPAFTRCPRETSFQGKSAVMLSNATPAHLIQSSDSCRKE